MTVKKCIPQMTVDYKRKNEKRAAYEELVTACNEWKAGFPKWKPTDALENADGHVKYKTFATLLIQNLQKGSRQWEKCWKRNLWKPGMTGKERRKFLEKQRQQSFCSPWF